MTVARLRLAAKHNTVQRSITTVWTKVLVNGGWFLCSMRHFFQRDIFCLITRGLMRLLRVGICSRLISQITASYHREKLALLLVSHSGKRVLMI